MTDTTGLIEMRISLGRVRPGDIINGQRVADVRTSQYDRAIGGPATALCWPDRWDDPIASRNLVSVYRPGPDTPGIVFATALDGQWRLAIVD